ncbi:hypothetical protein IWQ57_003416, partial [Coemansia nantahalensis]
MMLGTPGEPRSVVGNELVLLWAATAGITASWSAVHLLVAAFSEMPSRAPAGEWTRAALWSVFIVATLTLGTAMSTNLYQVGLRDTLCLIVPVYVMPGLCAAVTMPRIVGRLRGRLKCQRQRALEGVDVVDVVEDAQDIKPLETHSYSPPAKSLHAFDGMSLASDMTQLDRATSDMVQLDRAASDMAHLDRAVSNMTQLDRAASDMAQLYRAASVAGSAGNGIASPPPPPILAPSPVSQHHNVSVIPTNTTTLVPPPRLSFIGRVKKVAATVILNEPLVVSIALLSIAVQALLFSGTVEQHQHGAAAPDVRGAITAVPALFQDNMERTVNISIACNGGPSRWGAITLPDPPSGPTILIEHVAGYPSLVSRSLHDSMVEQGHRVCVYDRPGYGHSPQGFSPISPVTLERALSSSLRTIGENGPFYVIGHRSGAEYARLFATLNRGAVIGMALVYPTDGALRSLLGPKQSEPVRIAAAQAMLDGRLLPEPGLSRLRLNAQRALAALGTWLTSPPTVPDTNHAGQKEAEWVLLSPYLAQAQYFEMLQQPELAQ